MIDAFFNPPEPEMVDQRCTNVCAGDFYQEYHGHQVRHLEDVRDLLEQGGAERFVYLAGDSSLDNKHWFFPRGDKRGHILKGPSDFVADALNGYERVLSPPFMVKDVSYWLNQECAVLSSALGAPRTCVINTAVEESCLVQREVGGLLPQDDFIRRRITNNDILVVDVGGNDVALRPTKGVIFNMAWLLYLTPTFLIEANLAPGILYFVHMFRVRLRRYIESLIDNQERKPKKVIVCMLYFLDETNNNDAWADGVLKMLGYDSNPEKLQTVMRKVYAWGVSKIEIPGVEVVPLPLFEVLDGKNTEDYVQRVEPSVTGGEKMARAIAQQIFS